ncbi:MAG TPA: nucleoside hydrolase, partial [Streptosporangiaceae bacterium]
GVISGAGGYGRVVAKKIILDCDPGIDDALAIAFAAGCPDLDLLGITTVAGNVGLDLTTTNAQRVSEFVGIGDTPVTPGAAAPLLRPPIDARLVHGDSGLGGARLPDPVSRPAGGHAIDYLIDTIKAAPGEITLVATGPLTNIALAVHREPLLVTLVKDFVIMGGSAGRGNVTPAAEFNIAADPEAAAIVFRAGWTVTMVGLDLTLRARATAAVQDRMRPLGRLATELLLPGLSQYASDAEPLPATPATGDDQGEGGPRGAGSGGAGSGETGPAEAGPAVHDVCAVAYVAAPALLGCLPARVEVETIGRWTAGMTVTDFRPRTGEQNALVAAAIDVRGFWDLVLESYGRVAAAMTPA